MNQEYIMAIGIVFFGLLLIIYAIRACRVHDNQDIQGLLNQLLADTNSDMIVWDLKVRVGCVISEETPDYLVARATHRDVTIRIDEEYMRIYLDGSYQQIGTRQAKNLFYAIKASVLRRRNEQFDESCNIMRGVEPNA